MNYIIESILVGCYTCLIYLLVSPFIKNFFLLLLVVGFLKHFLGSSLGIWTWYCNNGEACLKALKHNQRNFSKNYEANTLYLIRHSIYESIAFLILGIIFRPIIGNIYLFFTIGLILHILAEKFGVHTNFCKSTCYKRKPN
jgi:hypothetical protein